MPTLHMEVEQTRSVNAAFKSTLTQMSSMLSSLTSKVSSLQASWKGPSANEFQMQFNMTRSSVNKSLEQLTALQLKLTQEIAQWEATGNKLG